MEKLKVHDLIADPTYIRYELLTVIWILYLWELYLSIRQRQLMQNLSSLPKSLEGLMSEELYQKARLYALDKNGFGNLHDFYSTVINTILVLSFVFYYYWQWSIMLMEKFGIDKSNDIVASGVCLIIMNTVLTVIDFPFKIYNIFILEEKHGFNKQTVRFFIRDQLLKYLISQLIGPPLLCGLIWIVKNGGDYFFLYVWLFTVVVTLFMSIIYPEVIAPLFDKYSPLPEGELKQKIEALASSLNFPLYKLYIVEGSKRSSHSNAYMYGFYKHKRIVLFDTLVKEYYPNKNNENNEEYGCDMDEVLAILVHELGHWQYSHTLKGLALAQINFVMNFIPFAKLLNYGPIYEAFGFSADNQPIFIGLIIVIMYILTPLNTLFGFFMTVNSRRFEFQADAFGKKLGHGPALKRALIKLHKDNLSYPLYDKLYSGWHHSHPPLLERLEALDKVD
ncbi:CAAX prenyl protease 1 homolog [Chelonus insularis]|uniref:CAAX prenyl protease 1 homolog n=1 Tax=Chelonus insularis TaxID=460826 RepID=UPI00158CECA8|nr:CAAX prenyl protease 1 homolog [Chelonus insularis]